MREKLEAFNLDTIKDIAKEKGLKVSGKNKAQIIDMILEVVEAEEAEKAKERKEFQKSVIKGENVEYEKRDFDNPEYIEKNLGDTCYGLLEIVEEARCGFIRCENYLPGNNDVYVSIYQIRKYDLRTGDIIRGYKKIQSASEKFPALLKIIDVNITQIEEKMLLAGDFLPNEQRYQIHQLLAQTKQKRAAKDISAVSDIEQINLIMAGEKSVPALTLKQERVLAKDDALATVVLYEKTYSSLIGLTPKEQRQLTKQIKALTKQARKEILNAWKQKELTLPELQIRYTDIYTNLWLQIETMLDVYERSQIESSSKSTGSIIEMDEDNELGD